MLRPPRFPLSSSPEASAAPHPICLRKPVAGPQGEPSSLGPPQCSQDTQRPEVRLCHPTDPPKLLPVAPGTPQVSGDPHPSYPALGRCFVADTRAPAATWAVRKKGAVFVIGAVPWIQSVSALTSSPCLRWFYFSSRVVWLL